VLYCNSDKPEQDSNPKDNKNKGLALWEEKIVNRKALKYNDLRSVIKNVTRAGQISNRVLEDLSLLMAI
jgi:hypothetical protein